MSSFTLNSSQGFLFFVGCGVCFLFVWGLWFLWGFFLEAGGGEEKGTFKKKKYSENFRGQIKRRHFLFWSFEISHAAVCFGKVLI